MRRPTVALGWVCLMFLAAAPRSHAAPRAFVSVRGTNAGSCADVLAPCRTLAFAIGAVDSGGEVIILTSGAYAVATITKAVRVNAPLGVVAFTAQPITVNAGASDTVVLRGLTSKAPTPGSGKGVSFTGGAALYVENCVFDGWGVGIDFQAATALFVTDTTIRNSADSGIYVTGTAAASIARSVIERNGLASDSSGVFADGSARVSVRDSVVSGNAWGVYTHSFSSVINVDSSLLANNISGGAGASKGTIRVSHCTVTQNGLGLKNFTGTLESFGNNVVRGNTTDLSGTITTVPMQ